MHHRGREHVGRHCPDTNNIWCGSVQALLRYRSKTAKMQKFPIDSHSNENFICPFSARRGPPTPKRGEDTSGTRVRLHADFGVNRPADCREIVDEQTNKHTVNQIPRPSLYERMAGNNILLELARYLVRKRTTACISLSLDVNTISSQF